MPAARPPFSRDLCNSASRFGVRMISAAQTIIICDIIVVSLKPIQKLDHSLLTLCFILPPQLLKQYFSEVEKLSVSETICWNFSRW